MSAYMTETEQLEAIKKWWLKNQGWITSVLLAVLVVGSGYRYWNWHTSKIKEQASMTYQSMMKSALEHNDKATQSYANMLTKDYSSTVYASVAHLELAKVFASQEKYEQAIAELRIVARDTKVGALRELARIRIARLFIANKQYDQALKELAIVQDSTYITMVNELKGDIFVAKHDFEKAVASYQSALKEAPPGEGNLYLEMKYNSVASLIASQRAGLAQSQTV